MGVLDQIGIIPNLKENQNQLLLETKLRPNLLKNQSLHLHLLLTMYRYQVLLNESLLFGC
jgi:hypothetical protein